MFRTHVFLSRARYFSGRRATRAVRSLFVSVFLLWPSLQLLLPQQVSFAAAEAQATEAQATEAHVTEESTPVIKLKAGTIVPGDETASAAGKLTVTEYPAGYPGLYIVQFTGPVAQTDLDAVTAVGATLLDYLPDYAFRTRMTPEQAALVGALDVVNYVTIFQPGFKLAPDLRMAEGQMYTVRLLPDAEPDDVLADIDAAVDAVLGHAGRSVRVMAHAEQIWALAAMSEVAWIENFVLPEKHNEYGGGAILGAIQANAAGYDGATQIIAIADTGLGRGSAPGIHPDISADRVVNILNYPGTNAPGCYTIVDDGARDLSSGHGTHVAVTAIGDGGPAGTARGVAPSARLLFQALENYVDFTGSCELAYADGYYLYGIPDSLDVLYHAAYNAGARVHSNSWGSAANGAYTSNSAVADDFVWRQPDMFIAFSVGNRGADADRDGFVDPGSLEAPATAKNVLSVGASENDRGGDYACDTSVSYPSNDPFQTAQTCADMRGQNQVGTYGERWPEHFPVAPLAGDATAGNGAQTALFSGRGPTDDGRIKPDVVAPGTWVLSGYSAFYREGYDAAPNERTGLFQSDGWGLPHSEHYKYLGGTSMATPLAAGAAVLVRDFYEKAHQHAASAALVKATLINTAVDLPDENNDGVNDNDFPIPNIHEGWGRINLVDATQIEEFVDEPEGVLTDTQATYTYTLAGGTPFKVTLVWSDFPSSEAAAVHLVNDLDLQVTAPDGATYLGNVFGGGWSQIGGASDRVNNVENVYVQSAAAGAWTVTVRGHNVPSGRQPFALVLSGSFETPPVEPEDRPPTVTITAPLAEATVQGTVNIAADVTDDRGVQFVQLFVDGGFMGADTAAPYTFVWDSAGAVNGAHTIRVFAVDSSGQTAEDEIRVMLNNPKPDGPPRIDIIAPEADAVVDGLVTIAVNAEDDYGLERVDIIVNGSNIARDSTPPYIAHWDSRGVANGLHEVRARAFDSAGQSADVRITVTVDNPPVQDSASVRIVEPGAGAAVRGTVNIEAEASAPGGIRQVEYFVNGNTIGTVTTSPYAVTWNSRSVTNGVHTISARMIDANGRFKSDSVDVEVDNPPPVASLLLSMAGGGDVGFRYSDEDILLYDPNVDAWALFFDGSDVGLGASPEHDVDALHLLPDGSLLLSTAGAVQLPRLGWVDGADIVRFVPQTLGANTSGRFELYFEGSDVGLIGEAENVDGISVLADGRMVISTAGTAQAPGVAARDEDLLIFVPSSLGADTAGTWGVYIDGSDIGLDDSGDEDVNALALNAAGEVYLSTQGAWAAGAVEGTGVDIFTCRPGLTGALTQCEVSLFWRGADADLAAGSIDALSILPVEGVELAPRNDASVSDPAEDTFDDAPDASVDDAILLYLPHTVR